MLRPFLTGFAVSTGLLLAMPFLFTVAAQAAPVEDFRALSPWETTAAPQPDQTGKAPLTIAYSNGSKERFLRPTTKDEEKVLRQILAAGDAVLTPLPVVRAPAAFLGRTTDCLLGSPWQIPADAQYSLLVSPVLMTARFSFFQQAAPPSPADRPLRIGINRDIASHVHLPDRLLSAEIIQVNDVSQSVKLLQSGRVDYIAAYDGNIQTLPDYASGQIQRVNDLPPAFEKPIAITCHNTPQAAAFLNRLTAGKR